MRPCVVVKDRGRADAQTTSSSHCDLPDVPPKTIHHSSFFDFISRYIIIICVTQAAAEPTDSGVGRPRASMFDRLTARVNRRRRRLIAPRQYDPPLSAEPEIWGTHTADYLTHITIHQFALLRFDILHFYLFFFIRVI